MLASFLRRRSDRAMASKVTESRLDTVVAPCPRASTRSWTPPATSSPTRPAGARPTPPASCASARARSRRPATARSTPRAAAVAHRRGALEIVRAGDTVLAPTRQRGSRSASSSSSGSPTTPPPTLTSATPATPSGPPIATSSRGSAGCGWGRSATTRHPRALPRGPPARRGAISARREALVLLRAVLRWGRRRHPRALTADLTGLFELRACG